MQYNKYIYKTLAYLFTLLLAIISFSCRENEDHIQTQIKQAEIIINIRIPSLQEIGTNSKTETILESTINQLTLLAYQDNGSGTKELKLNKPLQPADYRVSNDMVNIKVQIPEGKYDRLVFIANADNQAQTLKINSDYMTLNALEYENSNTYSSVNKMLHIPMSAVLYSTSINGLDITNSRIFDNLSFIRMLARVDIINSFSSKFKLQTVYIYNANENGTIIADNETYEAIPRKVKLPFPLHKAQKPISFDFSTFSIASNTKQEMLGQIYLFEAEKANNSTITTIANSPRVVIYGEYPSGSGIFYYYPIDFTYASSTGTNTRGEFMPIVRNHKYILDIVRISGPGFTSAEKAMQLQTPYTNIEVRTHQIDDNYTDVYYNGRNYLASNITGRHIVMGARVYLDKEDILPIEVLTDLPTFTVEAYDKNKDITADWFTVGTYDDETGPTFVGNGVNKKLYITSNSPSNSKTQYSGYIVIKAGDLVSDTIPVDKLWCGQNGVPLVQDIGGKPSRGKYMTHQFGDECWMVENMSVGKVQWIVDLSKILYTAAIGYGTKNNVERISDVNPNYPRPNDGTADHIYYYTFYQSKQICPDGEQPEGWVLPSVEDIRELESYISPEGYFNQLGAKFWGENSTEYKSLTGAFPYYIEDRKWRGWGKVGYWWHRGHLGVEKYYKAEVNDKLTGKKGITYGTNTREYFMPVRCIFKQLIDQ